jgi:hypothetical protein
VLLTGRRTVRADALARSIPAPLTPCVMTPEVISSEPLPPVPMSPTPATTSREQQQQQHLAVAATVLQQAVDLVRARLTDDAQLTVSAKFLPGSTIGACVPRAAAPRALTA